MDVKLERSRLAVVVEGEAPESARITLIGAIPTRRVSALCNSDLMPNRKSLPTTRPSI